MQKEQCFSLGKITKLHGYKGGLILHIDSSTPHYFKDLESVLLDIDQELVPFFLSQKGKLNGKKLLIYLEDVRPEDAYKYVGREAYLPESMLPEAEDVDIQISSNDLRIDTMRSSGAGGQHVNTTDSAVRITHIPTGIVVTSSEKSQHRNREIAMQVLKTRLYDLERQRVDSERSADRKSQVGSGDRSERIRTYNFPQGRVTDHRINLTLYKLDQVMQGDLAEMVSALIEYDQAEKLAEIGD